MHVILSHPTPPDEATSAAIILSNISSIAPDNFSFFFRSSPIYSAASYEVKQSQIPSQARIRKLTSEDIFSFLMSGMAVIIWSLRGIDVSFLYSRSPNDLERFRIPFTLLSSTNPPAFSILYLSSGSSGLWSTLNSIP